MSKDVKEIIQALESCYLGGDICEHNFYEEQNDYNNNQKEKS